MKTDKNIPLHIGIIMDGNRRWAKEHKLQIIAGHRKAAEEAMEPVVERAVKIGIKYLTFWCFSTENWKRDRLEVEGLLNIFRYVLDKKLARFREKGVKINFLGDISKFPDDIQKKVKRAREMTAENKVITVNFALNYGGREEVVRTANKIFNLKFSHFDREARQVIFKQKGKEEKIMEEDFEKYLDTAGQPDPDLIIRTGGEMRLSGFLPWQSVYSELYFMKKYFPDFTPRDLNRAVEVFQKRQRRFGK